MCAYKIAPFQARTLPLLLEHVGIATHQSHLY